MSIVISKHPPPSFLNKTGSLRRGCSYESSSPVVFLLNRKNLLYFLRFMYEMFPRLGEIFFFSRAVGREEFAENQYSI